MKWSEVEQALSGPVPIPCVLRQLWTRGLHSSAVHSPIPILPSMIKTWTLRHISAWSLTNHPPQLLGHSRSHEQKVPHYSHSEIISTHHVHLHVRGDPHGSACCLHPTSGRRLRCGRRGRGAAAATVTRSNRAVDSEATEVDNGAWTGCIAFAFFVPRDALAIFEPFRD